MTYNPNIPQSTDNLSTSQGQMLNNFSQLDVVFAVDHYTFDDPNTSYRGMHKQIDFPVMTTPTPPSGVASVFYSKSISSLPAPYFDTSGASNCMWYGGSSNGKVVSSTGSTPSNGYITFPNGIIFQWASASVNQGTTLITFPLAFPNNCFSIQATATIPASSFASLNVKTGFTKTQFSLVCSSNGTTAAYLAIGN